jgi:hypothetical protein
VGNSASAVQTVSPNLTPQASIRQSLDPVAGQIWQRPFNLVRLAGDAGAGQSKSGGLLWYWPLAGILWGLLYSGVAMWRYRPFERAAQLEPPVLNESWFSRRPTATEQSVEPDLSKKVASFQEKAIEAALTECAGRVSGRPTVALQALWALRTFLDESGAVTPASPLPPCKMSDSTTSLSGCGNGSGRSSTASTIEKMAVEAPIPSASISTAAVVSRATSANDEEEFVVHAETYAPGP